MNNSLNCDIIKLYEVYGFEVLEERKGLISFLYKFGLFYNVEIVVFGDIVNESDVEKMRTDYEKTGYQATIFRSGNYEEIHMHLFNSFFSVKRSRERLKADYDAFCLRQKASLHNDYRYVEAKCVDNPLYASGYVSHIVKTINESQPMLTIIEAAAGYGKTCTVFEIIRMILESEDKELPLLIELSKNRNARIFKYVLQDEINQKFSQLSYELVLYEVKNGLIPLVIDGFDELIEPSNKGVYRNDIDEQSATMLTTIADILGDDSKAKIVLTSRRSAMFTGDIFDDWVGSKLSPNCLIERHQIPIPNIVDWIGEEKYKFLAANGKITNIGNPVVLSFIANNVSVEELQDGKITWEDLLEKYFGLLLNREQERQELLLDYGEIYEIMKKLAAEFARYDITAEQIEFIQELLKETIEDNILEYRTRYTRKNFGDAGILTEEEYVKRLSHNSLLDRHVSKNSISFINEFILGVLVGDALRDHIIDASDITSKYADLVITAYETRSEMIRRNLYSVVSYKLESWGIDIKIKAESKLLGTVKGKYRCEYLYGIKLDEQIQLLSIFDECTFENCVFNHCVMDASKFCKCTFIDCRFYGVTIENAFDNDTVFASCTGNDGFPTKKVKRTSDNMNLNERTVLEQFWKPGYATAEPRRTYTALFRGIPADKHVVIKEAIDSLKRRGLIRELNVCYSLNFEKINEIECILGRR